MEERRAEPRTAVNYLVGAFGIFKGRKRNERNYNCASESPYVVHIRKYMHNARYNV